MEPKRKKCRLWWPTNLSSTLKPHSQSFTFFFGWFIFSNSSSEPSVDIVVAYSVDDSELSSLNLQEIVHQTNEMMPPSLQDKCTFSLLGYCRADLSCNGINGSTEKDEHIGLTNHQMHQVAKNSRLGKNLRHHCRCYKVDEFFKHFRLASEQNDNWIQFVCTFSESIDKRLQLIPKLHHIHWNGEIVSELDLHNLSDEVINPMKKPKWIKELQQKYTCFDLDAVTLAINCVNSAKTCLGRYLPRKRSTVSFNPLWMMTVFPWKLFAVLVASFSTLLYIILQSIYFLLNCVSQPFIYITLANLFHNTCRIIEIRCRQFLYWPIFLQNYGLRSQSCVEYAERAALLRHSIWSSLLVDALLGNFFGIALWSQSKPVYVFVSNFIDDVTNYLLRSGCVWLMGNPAGFKLNTELAAVLGMMSLDLIQVWSTLWSFLGFLFILILKMIALSGIVFGLSVAAALIIDMISLVTKHLPFLHWLLSLLYSRQIQAIAALWRLFRGIKWNPLRQRLDSYDYNVEQHVIGSLLFTPLLLLLPTTSSFYTFFTIMNSAISFICIVMEVGIYVIHGTPYNKIFLWLVKKKRFPAGIWFEFVSCQHKAVGSATNRSVKSIVSSSRKSRGSASKSTILVSSLHSNYSNLGELVRSNYGYVHSAFSRSSFASSAYGILTGKRIPPVMGTIPCSRLPWMVIPYKQYWRLCYDAVFACREN